MTDAAVVLLTRRARREFLWVQRPHLHPFLGGYWALIGGGATEEDHLHEDPKLACAKRELAEELGLELHDHLFQRFGTWSTPKMFSTRYESTFFVADLDDDVLPDPVSAIDEEAIDAEWITVDDALHQIDDGTRVVSPPIRLLIDQLATRPYDLHLDADTDATGTRPFQVATDLFVFPLRTATLPPAESTNVVIVGGLGGDCWIVDPGTDDRDELERLYRFIDAHGGRPRAVILTHHHPDHVLGAPAVAARYGVPIWAHSECESKVDFVIERNLSANDQLEINGARWEVLYTPGHSSDHIALESNGMVVGGDLIASFGTILVNPPDGHIGDYLRSLDSIAKRQPKMLVPAHGWVVPEPEHRLRHYIAHRLDRERKILETVVELGAARIDQIVPLAYADTPESVWPFATRATEAHLIHLEEIGEAKRSEDLWMPATA